MRTGSFFAAAASFGRYPPWIFVRSEPVFTTSSRELQKLDASKDLIIVGECDNLQSHMHH